jgi:penicillin-insensitive murein endopeptidase
MPPYASASLVLGAAFSAGLLAQVGAGDDPEGAPVPPSTPVPLVPATEPIAPAIHPAEAFRQRAAAVARFRGPAVGSGESVGAYANGCLFGGAALPPSGPNFEVLHLGRNRRYGHPALVAFVRRLAKEAKKAGVGPLLVGDLSQPRGGPTPNGHRSHQTGLDVDIGFTRPAWMLRRKPTAKEREEMMPPVVIDLKTRKFTPAYGPKVERLIELAARDAEVERVFVNPHVKVALCKKKMKDRGWLRMVRPWAAHHDHLHARLKCPLGSPGCEPQKPVAAGDGCDEAERWVAEEERRLNQPPPPPPAEPRPPSLPPPLPPLPAACQALVDHAPAPDKTRAAAARDP